MSETTRDPRPPSSDDDLERLPLLSRLNERGFRLVMAADMVVLLAVMVGTMIVRFGLDWPRGPRVADPYTTSSYLLAFAVLAGLHFLLYYFGGLYERDPRLGHPPVLPTAATLSFVAILLFMAVAFVLGGTGFRPLPAPTINLVVLLLLGSIGVSVNRWIARRLRYRNQGPARVLLVGAPDELNVAHEHLADDGKRVEVVGEISDTSGLFEEIAARQATDVILLSSRWLEDLYPQGLRECEARDVGVLQRVTAKDVVYGLERVRQVGGMPFVPLREHTLPISRIRFKRFLEACYLLGASPVLVPLTGALCLYQLVVAGRPIFFFQKRVGRDGRIFEMVKFRTMRPEAEEETGPTLAERDDPRIIGACRWLRRTRLDELPQLWNVVRGEMSLVGPRPERPELTVRFEELIPGYATRYEIPPGITGLAQVQGGYHTSPEYKLGYDLQYLVNWSPLLDLEILLRTVWVVIRTRG